MQGKMHVAGVTVLLLIAAGMLSAQQGVQITAGPEVADVSNNAATIEWSTNVPAQTLVRYGTDPNNLNQQATTSWTSQAHSARLDNLRPGTTYYYQVTTSLPGRPGAASSVQTFQTQGEGGSIFGQGGASRNEPAQFPNQTQSSAPFGAAASGLTVLAGPVAQRLDGNSAQIWWDQSTPAKTLLKYGTHPNNRSQVSPVQRATDTSKYVTLENLQPGQQYFMTVETPEGQVLAGGSFQTGGAQPGSGLQIAEGPFVQEVTPTELLISWRTNGASDAVVYYGTNPSGLNQRARGKSSRGWHSVRITGLQPNTQYWIRTASDSSGGGAAAGPVFQARTLSPGQSKDIVPR